MACAFVDSTCTSSCTWAKTFQGNTLIDICFRNHQIVSIHFILVFCIGNGRVHNFFYDRGSTALSMTQNRYRFIDVFSSNLINDESCSTSSNANRLRNGFGLHVYCLLSLAFSSFLVIAGMPFKCSSWSKFTYFVADHVFCNINRNMFATVMDSNRVANKRWKNG